MYSVQIETSDGTLTRIELGIEYFEQNDITVYRNEAETPLVQGVDWQWNGAAAIIMLTGPEPVGNQILVFRNTDKERAFNIYDGGAPFSRTTLDENFKQLIYLAQEFTEGSGIAGLYRNLNMHGNRVVKLGDPEGALDATNKKYVDRQDTFYDNKQTTWNQTQDLAIASILAGLDIGKQIYTIPWTVVATGGETSLSPPFVFSSAWVWRNGVMQYPGQAYDVIANVVHFAEPLDAGEDILIAIGSDIAPPYPYPTRKKMEVYYSGLSLAIPTTETNFINLIKTLSPTSGSLNSFINTSTNKVNVYNEDSSLFFKVNITGSWTTSSQSRSMVLDFAGTNGNTLTVNRVDNTTPDVIQFSTYFSVDKNGNMALNGTAPSIKSNGSVFTATAILLTLEQTVVATSITPH